MIQNVRGSRAVVTGAASGIGYATARLLVREGAAVVLADYDGGALESARRRLSDEGHVVEAVVVDVSDAQSVANLKKNVTESLGGVDILMNNAGVAYNSEPLWNTPAAMAEWSFAVNVFGLINGIREFVPDMIAQGHGHIVNTASIGGFQVRKSPLWFQGLYAATKYAVVALSEALRQDLDEFGIGVSILAPSAVATGIAESDRNRPERFGGPTTGSSRSDMARMLEVEGMEPERVARIVLDGIVTDKQYMFTDPRDRVLIEQRTASILAGFDDSEAVLSALFGAEQKLTPP